MRVCTFTAIVLTVIYWQSVLADEVKTPGYVRNGHLIITPIEGSNTFAAYSNKTGQWTSHTFPRDVHAVPVLSGHCAAFKITGKSVTELVAVDESGIWRVNKLPHATDSPCVPNIGQYLAFYAVEGHTYAFSATHGKWDSIAAINTMPMEFDSFNGKGDMEVVLVVTPKSISAFSAQHPAWATIDTSSKSGD